MKSRYAIMVNNKGKLKAFYDLHIETLTLIENILTSLNISYDIYTYVGEFRPKNKKQDKKQK